MKYLALLSILALAGCKDVASPTSPLAPARLSGDLITNDKVSFSSPGGIVACNGETVTLSGTIHTMLKVTTNANGSTSFFSINETLAGVGDLTGAKYQGGQREKITTNAVGAQVFDMAITVWLIGQGNVPNTYIDSNLHVTQNANGDISVERFSDNVRCQD
jgi:hypothetical protein